MNSAIHPNRLNQQNWDRIAIQADRYYRVASDEQIVAAKNGQLRIRLTPIKYVPDSWLQDIRGKEVLVLAGGGGQQGPLLAAAGARTTVYDISQNQLERDRQVAHRWNLEISTIQGDMSDLGCIPDHRFDLVINPCSVCYCEDVTTVWREVYRVLRPGGRLLAGMIMPVNYLFDAVALEKGQLRVRHRIPYSDLELPDKVKSIVLGPDRPLEFGHTISDLIGQQIESGFAIVGIYEDRWAGQDLLSKYIDVFAATAAERSKV